jgi:hypothetical protein
MWSHTAVPARPAGREPAAGFFTGFRCGFFTGFFTDVVTDVFVGFFVCFLVGFRAGFFDCFFVCFFAGFFTVRLAAPGGGVPLCVPVVVPGGPVGRSTVRPCTVPVVPRESVAAPPAVQDCVSSTGRA